MAMKRSAQVVAETLNVLCPECGEAQPNPDNGADNWTAAEVRANQGERKCVSCDEPFAIREQQKVAVLP